MNRVSVFFCILLIFSLVNAGKIYELHLVIYKNDSVELKNLTVMEAEPGPFPDSGQSNNYAFKILSKNSELLFYKAFYVDFMAYRFTDSNESVVVREQVEDYWRLPYFDDAAVIQIFHDGKKIYEYKLIPDFQEMPYPTRPATPVPPVQPLPWWAFCCGGTVIVSTVAFLLLRKFARSKSGGGPR